MHPYYNHLNFKSSNEVKILILKFKEKDAIIYYMIRHLTNRVCFKKRWDIL